MNAKGSIKMGLVHGICLCWESQSLFWHSCINRLQCSVSTSCCWRRLIIQVYFDIVLWVTSPWALVNETLQGCGRVQFIILRPPLKRKVPFDKMNYDSRLEVAPYNDKYLNLVYNVWDLKNGSSLCSSFSVARLLDIDILIQICIQQSDFWLFMPIILNLTIIRNLDQPILHVKTMILKLIFQESDRTTKGTTNVILHLYHSFPLDTILIFLLTVFIQHFV